MRSNRVSFAARRSSWAVAALLGGLTALGAIAVSSSGCSLQICEVAACNTDPGGGGAGQGGGGGSGGAACSPECSPGANASAECVDGACVYTCEAGFESCDADPSDCEVDVRTKENCGACGKGCVVECSEIDGGLACNDPVEIAAGEEHTCVRKPSGSVFCWGSNGLGQVAASSAPAEPNPQKVRLPVGVRATRLASGSMANAIIDTSGSIHLWGNADVDALPWALPSSSGATAVAVYRDEGVFLRGSQAFQFVVQQSASDVSSLFTGGSAIARGEAHGCAIRSGNSVNCWGQNYDGQLGLSDTNLELPSPTIPISGLQATSLAAGDGHSCAIATAKQLYCWGRASDFAQVGHGQQANISTPQPVLADVDRVKLGPASSGALIGSELFLWGRNDSGQVSTAAAQAIDTPTKRLDVQNVVDFAPGGNHTCVLTAGAEVYCFGANNFGQLGIGNTTPTSGPVLVTIPRD